MDALNCVRLYAQHSHCTHSVQGNYSVACPKKLFHDFLRHLQPRGEQGVQRELQLAQQQPKLGLQQALASPVSAKKFD